MKYEQFARAYEIGRSASWSADEQGRLLTEQAAAWAQRFDEVLFEHLTATTPPRSTGAALRLVHDYDTWNKRYFVDTVRLLEATRHGNAVRLMHFHTLSRYLGYMWRTVAGHPSRPTTVQRRQAQLLIALHAANMVMYREHQVIHGVETESVRTARHGMLSESDAAIVLLELIRHRTDLLLLPAPPSYEAAWSSTPAARAGARRSVDLILLDPVRRRVAGIQVKTKLSSASQQRYDSEFVVLIDGALDLGNERLVRRSPQRSDLIRETWPGLISAHFVLKANPRTPTFRPWGEAIEQQRDGLEATVHGTSDYLGRAVAQVRRRVMAQLDID